MPQHDVAAALPIELISQLGEGLHGRTCVETHSIGALDFDDLFLNWRGYSVAVRLQAFQVKTDGFFDVLQGFTA